MTSTRSPLGWVTTTPLPSPATPLSSLMDFTSFSTLTLNLADGFARTLARSFGSGARGFTAGKGSKSAGAGASTDFSTSALTLGSGDVDLARAAAARCSSRVDRTFLSADGLGTTRPRSSPTHVMP